jgi:integrase
VLAADWQHFFDIRCVISHLYNLKNLTDLQNQTGESVRFFFCLDLDPEIIDIRDSEVVHILMLYWTGIREGELLALTPADFDFKVQTVTISKTYHRMKGSSRLEKIVSYLPDGWVRDALLLALEGRDLIEEKNRQRGRTRNIGHELR